MTGHVADAGSGPRLIGPPSTAHSPIVVAQCALVECRWPCDRRTRVRVCEPAVALAEAQDMSPGVASRNMAFNSASAVARPTRRPHVPPSCDRDVPPNCAERLYDLFRELVEVHVGSPDPPLLLTPAGLFV
jgi:hypothetical protein